MQVTRESSSELEFESRPTGTLRLFGLVALLFGLVMGIVFWEPLSLECERGGECRLQRYGLLFSADERFPASALRGARVEPRRSKNGEVYRVVLETARGTVPVTTAFSSGRENKDELALEVNTFVQARDPPSLSVVRAGLVELLLSVALLSLATWLVVRGSVSHVGLIQRSTRRLVVTRRGLLGRRTTEYPLSALAPLSTESAGTENKRPLLKLTLRTSAGEPVFEGHAFDTPETQDALARVNSFLGPQPGSRPPATDAA